MDLYSGQKSKKAKKQTPLSYKYRCNVLNPSPLHSKFDAEEHTAAQVKAEVDMHLAEKEKLEATIPSSIVIGK